MGSKGQLPLDFFESVGICDGAPSNVFKFSNFEKKTIFKKLHGIICPGWKTMHEMFCQRCQKWSGMFCPAFITVCQKTYDIKLFTEAGLV